MMEPLSWMIASFALIGTWLNIKKDSRCFVIWSCTNGFWAIYDAYHELYAQAALFSLYFIMAIIGLIKWRSAK